MASVSQVLVASGSSEIHRNISQVNDSLYLFYKPPADTPNIQILFFHGLQRGRDYSNAHVSTWLNRDGSCIWPQTWLVEEFPRAHVLSVCYTEGLKRGSNVPALRRRVFLFILLLALISPSLLGLPFFVTLFFGLGILLLWQFKRRERGSDDGVDMYIIGENLLSDLLDQNIGSSCPVVLVGHSIGGLVIKQLCQYAHGKLSRTGEPEKARLTAFLNNIKGIFFYSTPHHGSAIASRLKQHFGSHILKYFETLNTPASRLNSTFDQISKEHYKWSFAGLGETLSTDMGPFEEVVVEEASARGTVHNFYSVQADHFSICRPANKNLASFRKLTIFIGRILNELKEDDERASARTIERLPLPFIQNPKYVELKILPFIQDPKYVELKITLLKVNEALESKTSGRVVTLSGASGEGKTSMARHLALYYQNASRRSPDGVQDEVLGTQNSASLRFRDGVVFLTCSSNEVIISPLLELWKKLGYELLPLIEAIPGNASSNSGIQESSILEDRLLREITKKIFAQKILIVLDDVHDSKLLERFLKIPVESLKFLITTQNPEIWGDRTCKQIPIGTPTKEEACHILTNHAYGGHTDITQPMQDAIDAIVEKAARHPLVLANVAANIQGENDNESEEWENVRRNFDELVFEELVLEDEATNPTAFLYDEIYPRTVKASVKMTLSTLSKDVETKTLLLLASIFESQSTPEVVFKLFAKRLHSRLGKFPRWLKRLQDINFIRVDTTTDFWTTASERTWFLHPLRQKFIEEIKKSEVKSLVEGILERKTDDNDIAIIVMIIVYGQENWREQAVKALKIPTHQLHTDSFHSWSLHLAAIKSFVGLIYVEPGKEWQKKSDRLAKQILQKYIYCQELDDESVSILLSTTETYAYTLKALYNFSPLNSTQVLIPKTINVLVNLLVEPEKSRPPRNLLTHNVLSLLAHTLSQFPKNRGYFLSIPYAMERLMAFLADSVCNDDRDFAASALGTLAHDAENSIKIAKFPNATETLVASLADTIEGVQLNAAYALGNLAQDAENQINIGQFSNATERLVALLVDTVSDRLQQNASFALANLALDAENRINIGQFPNATERLVALLADTVSEAAQQNAVAALGNLAMDAENRIKIGKFPNAIERVVALLADTVGEAVQRNAAEALGNLALDDENRITIGKFPNAIERLVALLADIVSEGAQQNAAGALANLAMDVENPIKIGKFPNSTERLVALLADTVSEAAQQNAAHALGTLALDAENRIKIGKFPNAIERLVALLADTVSEDAQQYAAYALGNLAKDAEHRVKIAQFPTVVKRLVALLGENMGKLTRSSAGDILRYLSLEVQGGDYERVLEAYEDNQAANDPRHCYLLADRCFVKANRGDFEGALTDINKYIKLGDDRQLGLQERGIVRRMGGDLDGALADLNDSLSLESDDYECLKHRGLVKFLLLDEDGARADAECALRVKPAEVDTNEYGIDLILGTSSVEYLGYNLK